MQQISYGSWDGAYINEISYVDADYRNSALIHNYELTSFIASGEGTFALEHNYVIADSGVYSLCIEAEDSLPTEISEIHYRGSISEGEIENTQTMKFYFGSDIQKIYPELENDGSDDSISSLE